MKPKVYIETTIPSFYFEDRETPDAAARREWTREWWDFHRSEYDVITSLAVLDELGAEGYPKNKQSKALALISDVNLVAVEPEIVEIVRVYIQHKVMLGLFVPTLVTPLELLGE